MEEVAKEAKFTRERTTKLERVVINLSTTSYSNRKNTMVVINSLKDQVKELAMQIKELTNKFDCNAVTTRSGLATKELLRKDMEVDDGVKEDIQEEGMIVEEIAREPIKTKTQLTREAKHAIPCEQSSPCEPTK